MSVLPGVSIVTIVHDWSEFFVLFQYHWDTLDYPKERLEWIIIDDSKKDHFKDIPEDDNIIYIRIDSEEYLDKIKFKEKKISDINNPEKEEEDEGEKIMRNYFKKNQKLPNGFKRDYAVGLTSNEYIFHLDFDTIYNSKIIKRKLKYIREK